MIGPRLLAGARPRLAWWPPKPTSAGSRSHCPRPPRRPGTAPLATRWPARASCGSAPRPRAAWSCSCPISARSRPYSRPDPPAFFTTPHYDNSPIILVDLAEIDAVELRELITESWRLKAPPNWKGRESGFDR